MDDKTVSKVLLDVQKEYARSNKIKDKIIMLLIVLMFAEAVVGYSGFSSYLHGAVTGEETGEVTA